MSLMRGIERPWAVTAHEDPTFLSQISHTISGPFHLIHPATFAENLSSFAKVLQDWGVDGRVYYGKKANKAAAWLRQIALANSFVDVASVPELVHALGNGVRGQCIGVTGAAKSDELLWLALRHDCIVAIDAIDELERAIAVANRAGVLRVLLRLLPQSISTSRFGLNCNDMSEALRICDRARHCLRMEGFSFHLDGYAVEPRAELAAMLIGQCLEARRRGFPSSTISIGGGFACAYVNEADWHIFNKNLNPAQFHAQKKFERFYPYFQIPVGASMLDAILGTKIDGNNLASHLIKAEITLILEPGRALLDGAGMTVFPVQGFKCNADYGIVTVAGLSMSLSEQWRNSEFLPSPILVQHGAPRPQNPISAVIGGSSCMEYDMLTWRKVRFAAFPRYGDFIVYPNTAGYQMDKNESEFHQLPLPPKVVVEEHQQHLTWKLDQ